MAEIGGGVDDDGVGDGREGRNLSRAGNLVQTKVCTTREFTFLERYHIGKFAKECLFPLWGTDPGLLSHSNRRDHGG